MLLQVCSSSQQMTSCESIGSPFFFSRVSSMLWWTSGGAKKTTDCEVASCRSLIAAARVSSCSRVSFGKRVTDLGPSDLSSDPDPALRHRWHQLASSNLCPEYVPHPGRQDSRPDCRQMETPGEEPENHVDRRQRLCSRR